VQGGNDANRSGPPDRGKGAGPRAGELGLVSRMVEREGGLDCFLFFLFLLNFLFLFFLFSILNSNQIKPQIKI
jgi:hypothetical protein